MAAARDRTAGVALHLTAVVAAELRNQLIRRLRRRALGHQVYQATRRILPVQHGARPLDDVDLLQIVRFNLTLHLTALPAKIVAEHSIRRLVEAADIEP